MQTFLEYVATQPFYHVTLTKNLPSIMKQGLIPRLDKRGIYANNKKPAIYLFVSKDAALDGGTNWLADEFPDEEPLSLLKVIIPKGIKIQDDSELFGSAIVIYQPIPPQNITIVNRNF